MIFLKLIGKFVKVLRSAATPSQIAWGFALGAVLGLTPFVSLHNFVIIFLIIILNVNIASATLSLAVYSLVAWLCDPLFHTLGRVMLTAPFLNSTWTSLYNVPVAPLTRFNNTVLMGSLIVSILLIVPNFFFFKWFVFKYRDSWNAKIEKWKITQILKGSNFVQLILKFSGRGQ